MIYVRLTGGLGNQMFQYAAGRELAQRHQTELVLDVSAYENQPEGETPRHYELGIFKHSARLADGAQVKLAAKAARASRLDKLLGRKPGITVVRESGFPFEPAVLKAPDNSYLIGYWQSEKYFPSVRAELLEDFTLKHEPDAANAKTAAEIAAVTAVSLHVRRGDYVTNANAAKFHGMTSLEYYREAIKQMAGQVKEPHFFVFSDDPGWCRENLKFDLPMTFVTNNSGDKGYEDMRLMSQCRHHIIANSSFSWWGAWLNPRADKIVLAPGRWFNDSTVDTRDIYAQGWVKIGS
jgi:hypothetical protein